MDVLSALAPPGRSMRPRQDWNGACPLSSALGVIPHFTKVNVKAGLWPACAMERPRNGAQPWDVRWWGRTASAGAGRGRRGSISRFRPADTDNRLAAGVWAAT